MVLLINHRVEPKAIDTIKRRLICYTVLYWADDNPVYEIDLITGEPKECSFEYDKLLERELIYALKQSAFLDFTVEDGKITLLR